MKKIFLLILFTFLPISCVLANAINKKIEIKKINSNLYLVKSYKEIINEYDSPKPFVIDSNSLIYIDGANAYLIDTPWHEKDMPILMAWIKNHHLHLKSAIITHFHDDKSTGIGYLSKHNISTYASKRTNALLAKHHKPLANHTFANDNFILLKNQIEVYYPGKGHTADNVVIWLPQEKILVGGCLLKANEMNTLGWLGDSYTNEWGNSIKKVQSRYPNTKLIIPGHGKIGSKLSIINHTLNLVNLYNANSHKE